ncbi:MAG: 16S rRNA (cytosine(967)-C(5))-methyltransferase RsmB [Desulfobacteraceae bacterium]|nr:16S rRNA (cytosine(967)-C(5))-methyltransferase RsmB [Desulfobacteraceae bacterium]MBC2755780.1 16S rRNA (cytosine(967)-C(5))-methyltransferase RsmB [Desulfobacteraceae bacterium]
MKKNQDMTDTPRKTALTVLNSLSQKKHHHLDRIITDSIDNTDLKLSIRDRKFLNALIFGVLRWRGNLDWIISRYSKTHLEKINPEVLNILRLGLYQIFFLDRIPDSAAVHTSVEMAKHTAPPWVVKYVNAMLRNAIRNRGSLPFPSLEENPTTALSISKSFPKWLINRWLTRFGLDETEKLCNALNSIPPISVRCNTFKVLRDDLLTMLSLETEMVSLTLNSPDGLFFVSPKKAIHEFSVFKKGFFQVQDEAAQLITYLLSPRSNETILDACAGLGGKTGHIAQLMKNTGQIIAVDQDSKKLTQLNEAMKRLGICNVTTCVHDFKTPMKKLQNQGFDRILLDAPCSGLGVIRRNPDIKWDVSRKNLNQYRKKQFNLLENVSSLVKPAGTIVYVVCSFEPEENESVINDFLKTHMNFQIQRKFKDLPYNIKAFTDQHGFFRSFPHIHDMDGFFAACLKRIR